ncbi:YoaK family protein [Sanguibacter gelidistatuariae]|nr:YoaK family protein [Sanguibacter gelidistatuariae]
MIHPPRDDPHGPLPPLLLILSVVTGLVDSLSYLMLGHVFVANMTGNVIFLGFAVGGAEGFSIVTSITAILAFSVGALLGGRVDSTSHRHRGRLVFRAALIETVAVLLALGWVAISRDPFTGAGRYVLVVLLAVAMGLQNSAATSLNVPDLTTTVLTKTITGISADARVVGGQGSRVGRRGVSILAMFTGALVGALLVTGGHGRWVLVPAAALLAVVTAATVRYPRSQESWVAAR